MSLTGADLGFIKGGLTQGTNLLGRGVQSTLPSKSILELEGPGGMSPPPPPPPPPQEILKIDAKILQFGDIPT